MADDHAFFREGLVALLGECGLRVVDDVANGEAAITSVLRHRPEVLVLDLSMPGASGIDVTRRLHQAASLTRVVMLTVSRDEEDVLTAFLAGVDAYVLKDGPIEDVVEAVQAVRRGEAFVSPGVARQLSRRGSHLSPDHVPVGHRLTSDELLVLDLLAGSMNLRQISVRLHSTPSAIRTTIKGILEKIQAESRGDIAVSSLRDRIV